MTFIDLKYMHTHTVLVVIFLVNLG